MFAGGCDWQADVDTGLSGPMGSDTLCGLAVCCTIELCLHGQDKVADFSYTLISPHSPGQLSLIAARPAHVHTKDTRTDTYTLTHLHNLPGSSVWWPCRYVGQCEGRACPSFAAALSMLPWH